MIVVCPNCTARLQLEASKVPSRPFTVRCPKCQFIINAQPPSPAAEGGALGVGGDLPSSTRAQQRDFRGATPAPAYQSEQPPDAPAPRAPGETDVAALLASLLQRAVAESDAPRGALGGGGRLERRRVLICTGEPQRDQLARSLAKSQYEVFVAEDAPQAAERMREDRMDVVILDPDFDKAEQGATRVVADVAALRPSHRRRLFFVNLSTSARTGDQHAAFLNNCNLVLNVLDVEDAPRVLERSVRELNDLYRDFNKALNLSEL